MKSAIVTLTRIESKDPVRVFSFGGFTSFGAAGLGRVGGTTF
jgi:hypothetical protein